MKVHHPNTVGANKTAGSEGAKKSSQVDEQRKLKSPAARYPKGSMEAARTEISSKAKEMAKAKDLAMKAPESRESKIAELKRRISNNEYNVKPDAIADKMVDEHMQEARAHARSSRR